MVAACGCRLQIVALDELIQLHAVWDTQRCVSQFAAKVFVGELVQTALIQQPGCLEIGVARDHCPQLFHCVGIYLLGMAYKVGKLHDTSFNYMNTPNNLPVGNCRIEDLVGDVFGHLCDKFLLHVDELLCGIIFCCG